MRGKEYVSIVEKNKEYNSIGGKECEHSSGAPWCWRKVAGWRQSTPRHQHEGGVCTVFTG